MGSVYKALHLAFDELRALKVIAPELLTDELFVKRFKHEAVITRRLQHINAVRVDDIDEAEDGRPFIVMEFIEGKSLKKLIRDEGPLPVSRVLSIIKQSAAALDAANKLGMVHRDIKPDNIALVDTPDGEMVKVLDFGIAKMKEARMGEAAGLTLTGAGVVIGTPQYMSPEQAMGKRGDELDGRADLYSLGIVMYQMLTADLPFKADTTMEMLLAHMQKPPAPIQELHPELHVPEVVSALTMRLLEKNRDKRPASARVLIQEIEKAERDLLTPAPPPPPPGPTRIVRPEEWNQSPKGGSPGGFGGGAIPPRPPIPPLRPVEPPKPVPQPPPIPPQPQPPIVPQPYPPPRPPESRWGMWAALIVLLLGVGGGAIYILTHQDHNSNPPPPPAALTATLTAEPTAVKQGEAAKLRWSSQNATALDLEPNVGQVATQGSMSVFPDETTTYTLTATGPAGTGTQTSTAVVTVTPRGVPPPPALTATLAAEPSTVEKGHSVRLRWSSQNATSLTLEPGMGQVDAAGSTSVTPDRTTTYTLIASGPGGTQRPTALVTVKEHAVDQIAVKQQLAWGRYHLGRGEYDEAIAAFEKGVALDPSNPDIRQQLKKAINACKAERGVLGRGLKCGEQ